MRTWIKIKDFFRIRNKNAQDQKGLITLELFCKENHKNQYKVNIEKKSEDNDKKRNRSNLEKVIYRELRDFDVFGTFDCKVVRVFDGDTLHAAIIINGETYRVQCRLKGIDTPEMPKAHIDAMSQESVKAFKARDRLIELVTNIDMSILNSNEMYHNSTGIPMPSLTDVDMQKIIDEQNTLVLEDALTLEGRDKYGRSLATINISRIGNINEILVNEGHAIHYKLN